MGGKIMYYFFVLMMIFVIRTNGEVYKVGGSTGWTILNINSSFYSSWANSKVFKVGDIISFEYNKMFHDVVRVTHENYNACNATAPYAKWATGNDSFTIRTTGHYYFICGAPGHCSAGQKVDIRVLNQTKPSPGPSGPSSPGPDPVSSGPNSDAPSPNAEAPGPVASSPAEHPKKNASSSIHSCFKLWFYGVAVGLAAFAF